MYHNQQPTDGRSPSILENHLTTSYSLADVVSSTVNFKLRDTAYGSNGALTTTDSAYGTKASSETSLHLEDWNNLVDELGEAEDDRKKVGIENEDYSLGLESVGSTSLYLGAEDEDYVTLEPPPNEVYMKSLLETEIEVIPYHQKSSMDVAGDFFYNVSYYDGLRVEEIAEPEQGSDSDEPIFSAKSTSTTEDLDEDPNLDLESRVGFRN